MNEMQGQQQGKGQQLNVGLVIDEYKALVNNLIHEKTIQGAYIKQLEAMVAELQKKLDEATTVVEHN